MYKSYTILESLDFSSQNLYDTIDSYFDQPTLEKTKNSDGNSIYMCKMRSMLAGLDQRYIIAITENDSNPIGTKLKLSNINWKCFQTRTIPENMKIVSHSYQPKNIEQYRLKLTLIKREEDHTEYSVENNKCIISLLHKNKNLYEYPPNGNLAAALETYKTILLI